jgi:reverse gyrase
MLESSEAVVTSVRENIKRKWKPVPLATVALQTLASRKLHLSSDKTMSLAEELYNAGIIRCHDPCPRAHVSVNSIVTKLLSTELATGRQG